MSGNSAERSFFIVVAIGEPDHLVISLALAVPVARALHGHIVPLYVSGSASLPSWFVIPPESRDVVDEPMLITGRRVSAEILQYIRNLSPDLLIVNWDGEPSRSRYLLGNTLDPLIQYAPCDVAVVRVTGSCQAFAERMRVVDRVLVPAGGGPNASLALQLALKLEPQAQVTALRIAPESQDAHESAAHDEVLQHLLKRAPSEPHLQPLLVRAPTVIEGIAAEAEKGYDLVFIGASSESLVDRMIFGNLPQQLVQRTKAPLVIVRRHYPSIMGAYHRMRWRVLQLLPQLTLDERQKIFGQISRNARAGHDFYTMIILATCVASLGLLLNSPAVIIGAMIMAPLMSALVGISMGIVQGDASLLKRSARTTILGILAVLLVSFALGLLAPEKDITPEMAGRSAPRLLDLAVAFVSGAAAAYALSRRNVSSALPGVAIAVALVPPLSTVGLAISYGKLTVALGAALLFLTNLVAIISAASILFLWVGFRPSLMLEDVDRKTTFSRGVTGIAALLAGITIILTLLTMQSISSARLSSLVQEALQEQIAEMGGDVTLSRWQIVSKEDDALHLDVSVQAVRSVSHAEAVALQERLAIQLQRTVTLQLTVVPITLLEPFVPPTLTPTPTPSATATHTATATSSATPTATATPSGTATPTPTSTPTATAIPTETPTSLPSATETPREEGTDTPAMTGTPPSAGTAVPTAEDPDLLTPIPLEPTPGLGGLATETAAPAL